jgi:hypothetical protein
MSTNKGAIMQQQFSFRGFVFAFFIVTCFVAGSFTTASASRKPSVKAPKDSFLASDDYQDDDEVVGVFLHDPDYALMKEDFTRNGADEFDWGWAVPGLDIHKYSTVRVVAKDDFGLLDSSLPDHVKKVFSAAMKRLHLKVVEGDAPADLELALDVVDFDADSHFAFVTTIKPMCELEMRLRDLKTNKNLLLVRNQEHAATPKKATTDMARHLLRMLH